MSISKKLLDQMAKEKSEYVKRISAGEIQVSPFYGSVRDSIVTPEVRASQTLYFWDNWAPRLTPLGCIFVERMRQAITFRLLRGREPKGGERQHGIKVTVAELAAFTGLSSASIFRALANPVVAEFVIVESNRSSDGRQEPSTYWVRMDDPLVPEHREHYIEELAMRMVEADHGFSSIPNGDATDSAAGYLGIPADYQIDSRTDSQIDSPSDSQFDILADSQIDSREIEREDGEFSVAEILRKQFSPNVNVNVKDNVNVNKNSDITLTLTLEALAEELSEDLPEKVLSIIREGSLAVNGKKYALTVSDGAKVAKYRSFIENVLYKRAPTATLAIVGSEPPAAGERGVSRDLSCDLVTADDLSSVLDAGKNIAFWHKVINEAKATNTMGLVMEALKITQAAASEAGGIKTSTAQFFIGVLKRKKSATARQKT